MKFEANVEDGSVCSQQTMIVFGIWRRLERHVRSSDQYLIGGLVGTYTLEWIQMEHAARLVLTRNKGDIRQGEFHCAQIRVMMNRAYR